MVKQEFDYGFLHGMAASGFIVFIVDGRGTGFKGHAYRACVSENLGDKEAQDQIAAAK